MANFKSNAARKRFLSHKNKRKYAVGGLTPSSGMYGSNDIPYTSSIVYGESDPAKQEQLAKELKRVEGDTSYQEDAMGVLNRQDKIEGVGRKVGSMGINKLVDMAPDDFVGPDMGSSPGDVLKSGVDAFNTTRDLNKIYKGAASGKDFIKAAGFLEKGAEGVDNTGKLLKLFEASGDATQVTSGVKSGIDAIKSGAGVGTVAALGTMALDKRYDKITNDQTLEGKADFTNKELGLSAARGATAGVAGLSTAAAAGAAILPGMFAAGAANAWNPIGWATLAAAGIGAGVTAINRKRKANQAGDELERVEGERDADIAGIKREQRLDSLNSKQYSGFDYGGDTQNKGFYGKTGGVKYQTEGVRGISSSIIPDAKTNTSAQYDVLADNRSNKGFLEYNPSSRHDDIIAANDINSRDPKNARYINPENIYTTTLDPDSDMYKQIMNNQGGYPIGEAEVVGDFVPQDIPRGYDPYTNNSSEQKIFDQLGIDGVLKYRQGKSNQHAATTQAAEFLAAGGAAVAAPAVIPEVIAAGSSIAGSNAATLATNLGRFGATETSVGQAITAPFKYYGGNTVNAFNALKNGSGAWNTVKNVANLGYNALSTKGVANAYGSVTDQIKTELTGEGNTQNRLGTLSDSMSFLGGAKGQMASWLTGNKSFGVTPKEITKISSDIADKDWLSAGTRTILSPFKDSSEGSYGNMFNTVGRFFNKAAPNIEGDDNLVSGVTNAVTGANDRIAEGINNLIPSQNLGIAEGLAGDPNRRRGFRQGGVKNLPGGKVVDIGNGAKKYIGQTHAQGGIMADPQSEIENNEVEKDVMLKGGTMNPYIFSEYLKTDGTKNYDSSKESIANVAEDLAINGEPQYKFDQLATEQEKLAGRSGDEIMDTTMAKYGGYRDKGIRKYQTDGLTDLPVKVPESGNVGTSMLNVVNPSSTPVNYGGPRNSIGVSGGVDAEGAISNAGINFNHRFRNSSTANATIGYTPNNLTGTVGGTFGQNNSNNFTMGTSRPIGNNPNPAPTYNVGANFRFKDGGVRYQDGGVTQYQTRGLVMTKERQEQYENLIQWIPNVGYVGPDGTNYGFNEADVVDFVNRGGLDSYNANQGDNFMPSDEAMDQYDLENRQQLFRDALRGGPDVGPTNEAVANPNLRVGQSGDLVVNSPPVIDTMTTQEGVAIAQQMADEYEAANPSASNPSSGIVDVNGNGVPDYMEVNTPVDTVDAPVTNSGGGGGSGGGSRGGSGSYTSPFATTAEEKAFQDWANEQGHDTKGYGWGSASQGIFDEYGEDFFVSRANAGGDPLRVNTSTVMDNSEAGKRGPLHNNRMLGAALGQGLGGSSTDSGDGGDGGGDGGSDVDDPTKGKGKDRGSRSYADIASTGLKAAQFIPAAMAYMDKPDYMKSPEKVGGLDRVNLENVSLNDRQAAIKSDNAAMQRFISNAGMGSAGFAARMAGWQKKEGLSAAVTAEQQRMNTEINNREASMNVEVNARNKGIQGENITRSMNVDRFNKESAAATKAQRVSAMANATTGLLTQYMDRQRIDADDRRTTAIAGRTGIMDRERSDAQTKAHFVGTDITSADQEYWDQWEIYNGTKPEVNKFGGMRQIPSYGYSTK